MIWIICDLYGVAVLSDNYCPPLPVGSLNCDVYLCSIYSLYSWYKNGMLYPIKQLDYFLGNWLGHFSVLPYTTLIHDRFRIGLLASLISSQPFRRLNLSPVHPSYLSPTDLNIPRHIKPKTYCHEPSVTDASKPKKQIQYIKNVSLHRVADCPYTWWNSSGRWPVIIVR